MKIFIYLIIGLFLLHYSTHEVMRVEGHTQACTSWALTNTSKNLLFHYIFIYLFIFALGLVLVIFY